MNQRTDTPDGLPITGVTVGGGIPDIIQIHGGGDAARELIRISHSGELFWKGREVETDTDFRAAMLDLSDTLSGRTPRSESATPISESCRKHGCYAIDHAAPQVLKKQEIGSAPPAESASSSRCVADAFKAGYSKGYIDATKECTEKLRNLRGERPLP